MGTDKAGTDRATSRALALDAVAIVLFMVVVVAAVSLARDPLRSGAGRWATWLALLSAVMLPAVVVPVTGFAWLLGYELPEYWAQPIAPVWLLTGLAAVVLGVIADEPGRRGVLILPLVLGAVVLTFWLGEVLVPH